MTILDLGCGSGRDVNIASELVGEMGRVIGKDMTAEKLKVAKETQAYYEEKLRRSFVCAVQLCFCRVIMMGRSLNFNYFTTSEQTLLS